MAFALSLGPDLPWEDEPSPGNLGHSTLEILTPVSLLMPAFSLVCSPPPLSIWLQPAYDAPLPLQIFAILIFGVRFSPVYLRRFITRPVSYYALFE